MVLGVNRDVATLPKNVDLIIPTLTTYEHVRAPIVCSAVVDPIIHSSNNQHEIGKSTFHLSPVTMFLSSAATTDMISKSKRFPSSNIANFDNRNSHKTNRRNGRTTTKQNQPPVHCATSAIDNAPQIRQSRTRNASQTGGRKKSNSNNNNATGFYKQNNGSTTK
ncbi:hypothetical protein GJ496_009485 [Pomphorhynchus laevis]|nr:hypothetical protein GJ496_009485 [Pomphorhynchus laevis]